MSKYEPLKSWLQARGGPRLILSFAEIERLLGFALPGSARQHRAWWSNQADGAHTQAHAWMDVGWRVWSADLEAEQIEFRRPVGGFAEEAAAPFHHDAPIGGMSDPVTFDRAKLSITARRILDDYTAEFGGDVQRGLDKALHEARIAFRQRLIDNIPRGTPSSVNSVDLIHEDRRNAR
jgi:hypothetical protein